MFRKFGVWCREREDSSPFLARRARTLFLKALTFALPPGQCTFACRDRTAATREMHGQEISHAGSLINPLQHLKDFGVVTTDALAGVLGFVLEKGNPLVTGAGHFGSVCRDRIALL